MHARRRSPEQWGESGIAAGSEQFGAAMRADR